MQFVLPKTIRCRMCWISPKYLKVRKKHRWAHYTMVQPKQSLEELGLSCNKEIVEETKEVQRDRVWDSEESTNFEPEGEEVLKKTEAPKTLTLQNRKTTVWLSQRFWTWRPWSHYWRRSRNQSKGKEEQRSVTGGRQKTARGTPAQVQKGVGGRKKKSVDSEKEDWPSNKCQTKGSQCRKKDRPEAEVAVFLQKKKSLD